MPKIPSREMIQYNASQVAHNAPSMKHDRPTVPSKCCGRCPKPVRNFTVSRSRNPLTKRVKPYLDVRTGGPDG